MSTESFVRATGIATPAESAAYLFDKLRFHTDAWDLALDLKAVHPDVVVIDTRSSDAYAAGHIPGAVSFPHRTMNAQTTATLDRTKIYVAYCDGIGCNGSTQGSYKLASFGLTVKELIGGLDFWLRDGHPVVKGDQPGHYDQALIQCAC
ncbi:rhodanese-like domain-containing protein [Burkholderiaceae bacterium DAT-1]|nr:rhodanese-like domain-containing protein [Burkholderiaceae bacterium DAT-1]